MKLKITGKGTVTQPGEAITLTVRMLKEYLHGMPERDENGEPYRILVNDSTCTIRPGNHGHIVIEPQDPAPEAGDTA